MTQEEIISQGAPIEPNCFETDREEQWYKVGLYEGATVNQWHDVKEKLPKLSLSSNYLSEPIIGRNQDGGIYLCVYDTSCGDWLAMVDAIDYDYVVNDDTNITHWCEIPQFENKQPKK